METELGTHNAKTMSLHRRAVSEEQDLLHLLIQYANTSTPTCSNSEKKLSAGSANGVRYATAAM